MASSPSGIDIPMDKDWEYLHGRVDPGQDENISLVASVAVTRPEKADLEQRNNLSAWNKKSGCGKALHAHVPPGMPTDSSLPKTKEPFLVSIIIKLYPFLSIQKSLPTPFALSRCIRNKTLVQR
jgi:hypothetical protein